MSLSHVKSPEGQRFLHHWNSLRQGGSIPTVDAWVQHLPSWIAPNKFRGEVLRNDVLVLFAGSAVVERRGNAKHVGQSLFMHNTVEKADGLALIHAVVSQPCGLTSAISYTSNTGNLIRLETTVLPVGVGLGKLSQIVGFAVDLIDRRSTDYIVGQARDPVMNWLDVGFGTPDDVLIAKAFKSFAVRTAV